MSPKSPQPQKHTSDKQDKHFVDGATRFFAENEACLANEFPTNARAGRLAALPLAPLPPPPGEHLLRLRRGVAVEALRVQRRLPVQAGWISIQASASTPPPQLH